MTVHYKMVVTSYTIEGAGAAPANQASLKPTITPAEVKAIEPKQNPHVIFFDMLAAKDSYLYKFTVNGTEKVMSVIPNTKGNQAPDDTYRPGAAGYAWYDEKGKIIGKPHNTNYVGGDDVMPDHTPPKAGTYYLKVVGPGAMELVIAGNWN